MTNRRNKLIVISLAFILIFSMFLSGCSSKEEIVAKVNGEEITESRFEDNFQMQKKMIEAQYGTDVWTTEMDDGRIFEEVFKEKVLEGLITETVMLQEAEKQGIEVSKKEVDEEVEKLKDLNGGEENFNKSLEQNGITLEYLKESLRKEMILNQYQEDFIENQEISDTEAETHFNENKDAYIQVKVSHILVKTKEEAEEIIKELEAGKDFAELAKEKSIDTGSASNGGVYDFFTKGTMVPEFEEVAFTLEPGKISEPVETTYGYHIIKVEDKKETFEELKDIVIEDMKYLRFDEKITELRDKAEVEILLEEGK